MSRGATKGNPDRGSKAKKHGSHTGGRGASTLATRTHENPTGLLSEVLPSGGLVPHSAEDPTFVPPTPAEFEHAPSLKWVGRDPKTGKVIPHKARNEKIAQQVAQYTANGLGENEIAALLNLRPGHLRQFYYRELHNGLTGANMQVATGAFKRAKKEQRAAEFWLQARAGWRTKDEKNVTDVSPLQIFIHS